MKHDAARFEGVTPPRDTEGLESETYWGCQCEEGGASGSTQSVTLKLDGLITAAPVRPVQKRPAAPFFSPSSTSFLHLFSLSSSCHPHKFSTRLIVPLYPSPPPSLPKRHRSSSSFLWADSSSRRNPGELSAIKKIALKELQIGHLCDVGSALDLTDRQPVKSLTSAVATSIAATLFPISNPAACQEALRGAGTMSRGGWKGGNSAFHH